MAQKLPERRRFVRTEEPVKALIILDGEKLELETNNLSAVGVNFESPKKFDISKELDLVLYLPPDLNAIHIRGRVVWCRKTSLEDFAPHQVGVELLEVREEDKNDFLKFMCDMMYELENTIRT